MNNKSSDNHHFKGLKPCAATSITGLIKAFPHQVISQQLLTRRDFAVAVFYFDRGEGISTDIQHQDILYSILEGSGELTVNGIRQELSDGECMLVPAGDPHAIHATAAMWMLQISAGELTSDYQVNGGNVMEAKDYIKNIEKARVQTLAELVDYQADKVASLTLVQKDLFTTTLMAMDQGTGVGPHVCEGDAMVTALAGTGDVMIGEAHFTVKKGECIVMPAGIVHAVRGETERFKMMLIVSKPEA